MGKQWDDKTLRDQRWETRISTQQDNKIVGDTKWEIEAGIVVGTRLGIRTGTEVGTRADTGADIEQGNKKREDLGPEYKRDLIGTQSYASCFFFLIVH